MLPPADASTTDARRQRTTDPSVLAGAPANNPLELTAFLVRQTTNPQWFRHNPIKARTQPQKVHTPQPPTFVDTALARVEGHLIAPEGLTLRTPPSLAVVDPPAKDPDTDQRQAG